MNDDFDFDYQERDVSTVVARTQQDSGQYDRYFQAGYQTFNPSGGNSYAGRIAPPTWKYPNGDKADHWGMEIWLNYGLGAEQGTYLSRSKHGHEDDPIVDDLMPRLRARGSDTSDMLKDLRAKKRVLVWWLGRGQENEGWKLWAMPWTFDRDLAKRAYNKVTGQALLIDHHINGYDISFDVTGSKRQTKYEAVEIARTSSPIHTDPGEMRKLLKYIKENPLQDTLRFYDAEYLRNVVAGMDVSMSVDREEDVDEDTQEPPEVRDQEGVSASNPPQRESLEDPQEDLDAALELMDETPF